MSAQADRIRRHFQLREDVKRHDKTIFILALLVMQKLLPRVFRYT